MNPGPRRAYWLIGLVLLVAVVLVLIVAFVLNRQLRPRVGTEAPFTTTVDGSPSATPMDRVAAATPTIPIVMSSATPVTIATATLLATPVAVVVAPGATPAAPATVAAIEQAYLHYWEVYGDAVTTLDPSHLGEVMAGTELAGRQKQIADLQAKHQAAKIDVTHSYVIVVMGPTKAAVEDRYLNKSVLVDATTKRPLENPGAGKVEDVIFQMELTADGWKVASSSQVQP